MPAKIILFKKTNTLFSRCVAIVTDSKITHSAVLFDGEIYDSSEKRGKFGRADAKKLKERNVEVYHIGASEEQVARWLMKHMGRRYDYTGLLQWVLFWAFGRFFTRYRLNAKSKVYCFEATANLIAIVTKLKFRQNLSGQDLKNTLAPPEYVGKLKDYFNYGN